MIEGYSEVLQGEIVGSGKIVELEEQQTPERDTNRPHWTQAIQ